MRIDDRLRNDIIVVEPHDRLTVETEPEFCSHFVRLLEAGHRRFALNLADVPYIDSAGLGAIVRAYISATRRGGGLKLLNVGDRNRYLLTITKLITVFDTSQTEEQLNVESYERT